MSPPSTPLSRRPMERGSGGPELQRIVDVTLETTGDELAVLKQTFEAANEACRAMSEWAWTNQKFTHHALHQACYAEARASGLSAHFAERCLARVLEAYARDSSR